MSENRDVIDAEFTVAERRIPVRWGAILRWALFGGIACAIAYSSEEPFVRAAGVAAALFWLAIWPLFGLLRKPRLHPEEVEQLAQRLRANARPGRERR